MIRLYRDWRGRSGVPASERQGCTRRAEGKLTLQNHNSRSILAASSPSREMGKQGVKMLLGRRKGAMGRVRDRKARDPDQVKSFQFPFLQPVTRSQESTSASQSL